ALAVLICAVMQNQRRQDYVKLGWSLVAIVAAQALLGAVAVWTELNWVSVAGHFLLSMVSLTICVVLVWRIEQERRTTPSVPVDGRFSLGSRAVASLGFAV
ncbi:MAG TPA: COX15/CtaA family protein, partial [Baekduia sp.]|nr:COX15/CtaA family protein [Baekduia sp.]